MGGEGGTWEIPSWGARTKTNREATEMEHAGKIRKPNCLGCIVQTGY